MSLSFFPATGVHVASFAVCHGTLAVGDVVEPGSGVGIAGGVGHSALTTAGAEGVVAVEGVAREMDGGAGPMRDAVRKGKVGVRFTKIMR